MAEIRHQVPGASEEVESSEIHIPDDSDVGTGTFTVTLKPKVLPSSKVFWATIIHPPDMQITSTFDASMNVTVQLGRTEPYERKTFRIPASVEPDHVHILVVNFSKWKITGASLDGEPVASAG